MWRRGAFSRRHFEGAEPGQSPEASELLTDASGTLCWCCEIWITSGHNLLYERSSSAEPSIGIQENSTKWHTFGLSRNFSNLEPESGFCLSALPGQIRDS